MEDKTVPIPTVFIDCHIHMEKGDYTLDWIDRFVETAVNRGISEIWLLEHCYLFPEFVSMYDKLRSTNEYLDKWFARKARKRDFSVYLRLAEQMRELLGAQGGRYDRCGLDERRWRGLDEHHWCGLVERRGRGLNDRSRRRLDERRGRGLDARYNRGYPIKLNSVSKYVF